jgi:hypothetical protein
MHKILFKINNVHKYMYKSYWKFIILSFYSFNLEEYLYIMFKAILRLAI